MVISIKPANDHPQGTTLRMTFPKAFWTNDITNQAFLTTSLTCHTYTNVKRILIRISILEYSVWVTQTIIK